MSDLFGNHIVGFPMRRLKLCEKEAIYREENIGMVGKTVHSAGINDTSCCDSVT